MTACPLPPLFRLDLLRILGLFDRPISRGEFEAVVAEPPISGLTDTLLQETDASIGLMLARIRDNSGGFFAVWTYDSRCRRRYTSVRHASEAHWDWHALIGTRTQHGDCLVFFPVD